jgi:phosphomannomutase
MDLRVAAAAWRQRRVRQYGTGHFHTIRALKHLTDIPELVVKKKADLGVVVDPDVDRLAFICEDGEMFGEEYTLVLR